MLREGDKAPGFALDAVDATGATDGAATGDDGSGATRTGLADHRGRWLVLYFYPRDNTPGCTREAVAFSEKAAEFARLGASIVGVSKDSVKSHCGFRDKHDLRIVLASDPELSAHRAYGAYGEKKMYGKAVMGTLRSTFLVDPEGRIARVFAGVKVDGHADAVLAALVDAKAGAKAGAKALAPSKPATTATTAKTAKTAKTATTAKKAAKRPAAR